MATNYKQNDPAWAWKAYAGETMAYAGCGPTATADLLNVTPPTIADWMSSHGEAGIPCYASNGSGTYAQGVVACLKAYGHDAEMITPHSMAGSLDNAYFIRFFQQHKTGILWNLTDGWHGDRMQGQLLVKGRSLYRCCWIRQR